MRIVHFSPLHLLILIIAVSFLAISDCANSGRKRGKDVYKTPSTSRPKKVRNAGEGSSQSKATTEAGSSKKEKIWTGPLDNDILNIYFNNMAGNSVDWSTAYGIMYNKHPTLPPLKSTITHLHSLLQKIIQSTPAEGEGETLWTKIMKSELLRIYYQTRDGELMKHASRMYTKWKIECSNFPDLNPIILLRQAENMLIRNKLLDLPKDISEERKRRIWADKEFQFDSEKNDIIRNALLRIPSNEPLRIDSFYDELCKKHPIFYWVSPQKVIKKVRNFTGYYKERGVSIRAPEEAVEEMDSLNQSHHFHEFLDTRSHHEIHPQSSHHSAYEVGSSSSHQEFAHEDLDLGLSLGSLQAGTSRTHHSNVYPETSEIRHLDVDLELGPSSRKKKGKSIRKQS